MSDPSDLAVSPSAILDVGRQLRARQGGLERAGAHLRGPRPAPPLGDATCGLAYQSAAHQLAGLVTTAVVQERALADALTAAAAIYGTLDGSDTWAQR